METDKLLQETNGVRFIASFIGSGINGNELLGSYFLDKVLKF